MTLVSYRTVSGLSAGGTLLLVMGSAKLLEVRQRRDARVVAMVALVLLLAACLERQSLVRVPLYLVAGWLALAALAALGSQRGRQAAACAMAGSGRALLMALPLAALCFVLVPRLPGALWGLPPSDEATHRPRRRDEPGKHLGAVGLGGCRVSRALRRSCSAALVSATGAVRCCTTSMATPGVVAAVRAAVRQPVQAVSPPLAIPGDAGAHRPQSPLRRRHHQPDQWPPRMF